MINNTIIFKRVSKLRQYIEILNKLREEKKERFISDPYIYGNAERYLQLAIQSILDIGNHILSDKKINSIEEYKDIILLLGENNIIPKKLAEKISPLAGLRNILVHEYIDIDRNRIYDFLHNELSDFEEFIKHISIYL